MSHWNYVKSYKEDFEEGRAIAIIWTVEDVLSADNGSDEPITEDEAVDVLASVYRGFDAGVGINWQVIQEHIWWHKQNHCG